MTDLSLLGAFVAGVLTLLSPCSALLLPSFFAYAFDGAGRLLARTGVLLLGLLVALVPLGLGVGAIGSLVAVHRSTVTLVGAGVLILLGLLTMAGVGFALPGTSGALARVGGTSWLSVFLLGMVYGFAGACSGPLLGSVLTMALVGSSALQGGLVMALYAAGMAVPLFALALLWRRFRLGERSWLRGRPVTLGPIRTTSTALVSGTLLVGVGILMVVTDGTTALGSVLGVDSQFDLEVRARAIADAIPGRLVLAVILSGVGLALARALLRPDPADVEVEVDRADEK